MQREYKTIRALQRGEVVEIDGVKFVKDEGELQKGDMYIAERNTGPEFLTVKEVVLNQKNIDKGLSIWEGCIIPTTNNYPYNISECVKVKEA